ncbi:MAG TPA: RNA polymerase sigma-70 factor [Puia sp.]|nr:RNA polymerase sigma-70 factor [Puia sp.]
MSDDLLYDEEILLTELSTGKEDAFEKLYNHYVLSLKGFVIKFVKSSELAEDLTQEVFIKIWENRDQLAKVRSFRAYLTVIARNHVLNFLKSAPRNDLALKEIVGSYTVPQAENEIISKEYKQWLQQVLDSMSPQMRSVFELCREQNKSYGEVADLLQISRNTVKKHMVRSMKVIKGRLDKDLDMSFCFFVLVSLFISKG